MTLSRLPIVLYLDSWLVMHQRRQQGKPQLQLGEEGTSIIVVELQSCSC